MAEDDVELRFGASLEGLQAGIEEAKEQIEGLSRPISEIVNSFSELGEALAAAFAFEKIAEFAEHMGELGERTERTSLILGISTEQVGELQYIAAMTGTSVESITTMMTRLGGQLPEAAKGTGRLAAGLAALGLDAKELLSLNFDQRMNKIGEAISQAVGPNKVDAVAALGRGFVQLIPTFDQGAEGLDRLKAGAHAAGVALGSEMTERLVDMQHAMVNLKETVQGLTTAAFAPFINVVNGAVAILTDIARSMMESSKDGGFLSDALKIVAFGFQNLEQFIGETILILKDFYVAGETATNALVAAFKGFGEVVADVFEALAAALPEFFTALITAGEEATKAVGQEFVDLGNVIGDALRGDFAGAKAAFGDMGTDAAASAARIGGAFKGVFDFSAASVDAKKTADEVAKAIADGDRQIVENAKAAQQEYNRIWGIGAAPEEKKPGKTTPAPVVKTGADKDAALKAAEEEAAAEIKLFTDAANQREAILDGELKRHEITTSTWLAGTKDALADELQDTIATYQAELQTANLTAQQRKAISDKIAEAEAANAVKVTKAEQKAADEATKSWLSAGDAIAGILNSQVNGLLKGTETISQAFRNMAASIIEDLIKVAIKLAAEAAALEALSLATGGALGGFGAGGVGGFLAGALHFAEGTPYVQNTGLAVIHRGEMVTPADLNPNNPANSLNFADNRSGGGSGGGGTVHNHNWGGVHVNNTGGALDPAEVAHAMDKAVRSGAHTGLKAFAR